MGAQLIRAAGAARGGGAESLSSLRVEAPPAGDSRREETT
jgi:hypothetical protein